MSNTTNPAAKKTKPCRNCEKKPAIEGEKYCAPCKGYVIRQARKEGKVYEYAYVNEQRGRHGLRACDLTLDMPTCEDDE